jgi:hypothetical protein
MSVVPSSEMDGNDGERGRGADDMGGFGIIRDAAL